MIAEKTGAAWCRCPCGREGVLHTTHKCVLHQKSVKFKRSMRLVVPEETGRQHCPDIRRVGREAEHSSHEVRTLFALDTDTARSPSPDRMLGPLHTCLEVPLTASSPADIRRPTPNEYVPVQDVWQARRIREVPFV